MNEDKERESITPNHIENQSKDTTFFSNNTLENNQIRITDVFEEAKPLVMQGDRTILSRGNISLLIGKAKGFKTFYMSGVIAGSMGDDVLSMSGYVSRTLYIDTEQCPAHTQKVLKRIYKLANWELETNNDNLITLNLREYSQKERFDIVVEAINYFKPDLVCLDGLRDLLVDFNNIQESSMVVNTLMSLSTKNNCGILMVLHQNKNDSNARGHAGSEAVNKSETVLEVKNENGIACVSPLYSRNIEIENFSFMITPEGLPVLCNAPKIESKQKELLEQLEQCFFGSTWLDKKTLIERLKRVTRKTDRTCYTKIQKAIECNLITINQANMYILTSDAKEKQEVLDF